MKLYYITYNSWEGYYIAHIWRGQVRFYKDKQGLPYIDMDKSGCDAAIILLQGMELEQESKEGRVDNGGAQVEMALVQTVRANCKG
jgi:hypothetical protein